MNEERDSSSSNGQGELADCIRAALAGDGRHWDHLLVVCQPLMNRMATRFAQANDHSDRDLSQEAWIRVWQRRGQFRGAGADRRAEEVVASFLSWLRVTARCAMIEQLRRDNQARRIPRERMASDGQLDVADGTRTPSSVVMRADEAERLRAAIERLPDATDRQILALVIEDGLSFAETARMLGMDPSTVRRRFHRVLRELGHSLFSQ